MAWRRRTPRPGEQGRVLIVIVVLAFVTPALRQLIFGDGSLVEYFGTYFAIFLVLMTLAFATRLVRFGWERVPDGAAD